MIVDVSKHFAQLFEKNADKILMIDRESERQFSYSDFADLASRGATYLKEKGVKPGDELVVIGENSVELPLLFSAGWTLGAKITPLNPDLGATQLNDIIHSSEPDILFLNDSTDCLHAILQNTDVPSVVFHSAANLASDKINLLDEWQNKETSVPIFSGLTDDLTFLRIFTSGSTAAPKGINLKASRLINNEVEFCKTLGLNSDSRFYNILPMSYLGGTHNLFLLPMSIGGSFVLDKPLGPANVFGFWEYVRKHSINVLWFSPSMLTMLMALRDDHDVLKITSMVERCLVGMAPLPESTKVAFEERFKLELLENYALSETAFISTYLPGQDYVETCKGDIIPTVTVRIVDAMGDEVPEGQEGEIIIDSPYLLDSYSNAAPADTMALTSQGFRTGDLGYVKSNKLYLVGRLKDLIIRGGLNISPALVENQISCLNYVSEAAVVGVPHPIYGEEIAAAIVLSKPISQEEIESDLRSMLPKFQLPKSFLIVNSLPLGLTGKVDKNAIRQMFIQ